MSLATLIKGIGFANAGVHLCHALSYAINSMETEFIPIGYPTHTPFIPHGLSVAIIAPAVFYELGYAMPERCIQIAKLIGNHIQQIYMLVVWWRFPPENLSFKFFVW